jgi:hypothetical protein
VAISATRATGVGLSLCAQLRESTVRVVRNLRSSHGSTRDKLPLDARCSARRVGLLLAYLHPAKSTRAAGLVRLG